MTTLLAQLDRLMDGGEITRYHTKRVLRPQSVAAHSARVGMLCQLVWPECSANLLRAALLHDISELCTGDVPSPVKWANPALKAELSRVTTQYETDHGLRMPLTEDEQLVLRWADLAEGAQFCIEEVRMGNSYLRGTMLRYVDAMGKTTIVSNSDVANRQRVIGNITYQRAQELS